MSGVRLQKKNIKYPTQNYITNCSPHTYRHTLFFFQPYMLQEDANNMHLWNSILELDMHFNIDTPTSCSQDYYTSSTQINRTTTYIKQATLHIFL
jgi:hypothetical protein